MFSWLGDLLAGMGDALGASFAGIGKEVVQVIFDTMLQWIYTAIYDAVASFFEEMGSMGAEIFNLSWVSATTKLFSMFGWALFACGVAIAVFETAIEYQSGRGNIHTTALNVLKGFFAASLIGVLPVELYKFCISLQRTFAGDLTGIFVGEQTVELSALAIKVLTGRFLLLDGQAVLIMLLALIAFAYCTVKIFFSNIKRGGILLVQIAVGSLYMYSVPRGYTDGFIQWCKQVIALCMTAFMQYDYRQYYSGRQLSCLPKNVAGIIAASLTAGCLRLDAVAYPKNGRLTLGYELLVRQPETVDWICFDSPETPVQLKESAMAITLEQLRVKHGLAYTDCRFPELAGKIKEET